MSRVLSVRVSESVYSKLEAQAAQEGVARGVVAERILAQSLEVEPRERRKNGKRFSDIERAVDRVTEKKMEPAPTPASSPGTLAPCPLCDGPCIQWGTSRRCNRCQRNWPL